jgi:hypothetical protein
MVKLNKLAYLSTLNYQRVVLNTSITIAKDETKTIPHGVGSVPYLRVWGELFPGEFSYMFATSAQYAFALGYENAGLYGYVVKVDATNIYITSSNAGTKRVYLRAYAS